MKKVFVGGVFNDTGGRESGFIRKLTNEFITHESLFVINGGFYDGLSPFLEDIGKIDVLFWFCDVPNDKPKLVNFIFEKNKNLKLIISKNNRQNKYTKEELQNRINFAKSYALVEFTDSAAGIAATVHKKDGLILLEKDSNIHNLAKTLKDL